jgi:hypothetical protein
MTHRFSQTLDLEAIANRLKRISNGCRLAGGGLLLIAIMGAASYQGANENYDIFHIALAAIGSMGFASYICGHALWRAIYGSFPSVFPDHGPDAK